MRRVIPTTTSMLCFEASARLGSFTSAARELNIAQSAVSRQIALLETFVGQKLFQRIRKRVKLTPAGNRFITELSPHLDAIESTVLRLRSFDKVSGSLNVGVYPTLGSRWLMPKLLRFSETWPDMMVNTITFLNNEELDPALVDIAIVQGDPPWSGYNVDFLMAEELVVIASPSLVPKSVDRPENLLDFRILQHDTRPLSWPVWFDGVGASLSRTPTGPIYSQFEMLIEAVIGGHGIAIVPLLLVERDLREGRLVRAHPFTARSISSYYVLTPDYKVHTPKIERFRAWLLKQ